MQRLRTSLESLALASFCLLALSSCRGVVDAKQQELAPAVAWATTPCHTLCVAGTRVPLTIETHYPNEDGSHPSEPAPDVLVKVTLGSDAISVADTLLRTGADGVATTTLTLVHAAESASFQISIPEVPVDREHGWGMPEVTSLRILPEPPVLTVAPTQVAFDGPGCRTDLHFQLTSAGKLVPDVPFEAHVMDDSVATVNFYDYGKSQRPLIAVGGGGTNVIVSVDDDYGPSTTLSDTIPVQVRLCLQRWWS